MALPVASTEITALASTTVLTMLTRFLVAHLGDESIVILIGRGAWTTAPASSPTTIVAALASELAAMVTIMIMVSTSLSTVATPSLAAFVALNLSALISVFMGWFLSFYDLGFLFGVDNVNDDVLLLLLLLMVLVALLLGVFLGFDILRLLALNMNLLLLLVVSARLLVRLFAVAFSFRLSVLNLFQGILSSLVGVVDGLLGSELLVGDALVGLGSQVRVRDRSNDESVDLAVGNSCVVLLGASSELSKRVGKVANVRVVFERVDSVVCALNQSIKHVGKARQSEALGISVLDEVWVSLDKIMDGSHLTNHVQSCNNSVVDLLLGKGRSRILDVPVRVALYVEINLILKLLDLSLELGTLLQLLQEALVRLEIFVLELLGVFDNLVNLSHPCANLLAFGLEE